MTLWLVYQATIFRVRQYIYTVSFMNCLLSSRSLIFSGLLFVCLSTSFFPVIADEADEVAELKRQIEIVAQRIAELERQELEDTDTKDTQVVTVKTVDIKNVLTQGDRRNSILMPGTQTSLSIGGRLETSFIHDFDPRPSSRGGDIASASSAKLAGDPEFEIRGDTHLTARNSVFNIVTTTPTRFGQLRTHLEGDFNGPPNNKGNRATTNRNVFGLRHAYGQLGNVMFGHYWTSYMDRTTFPTKINGTGPVGRTFMRQGQLRYTRRFDNGGQWAVALENPYSDFNGADDENSADNYPDLISFYRYEHDRGHMQITGLLRRMGIEENFPGGAKDHATGWGFNHTGSYRLPWDDRVTWYMNFGDGIGRYLDGGRRQGVTVNPQGKLETQFGYGGFVSYRHWWTKTLSSSIDFGTSNFKLNPEAAKSANKHLYSSNLNMIWEPGNRMLFGIEYILGRREVHDGRKGTISRFQFTSRFLF
jgi:hypothetical protein